MKQAEARITETRAPPESTMGHHQQRTLRPLTLEEQHELEHLRYSRSAPAGEVARAIEVLAVAAGANYRAAARAAHRRSGVAVARLVARFNDVGMAAVRERRGSRQVNCYTQTQQERILREARRIPTREQDGTGTWTLATLQQALRKAPDGLPCVSTYTIWYVLHDAGFGWTREQGWCEI